MQVTLDKLEQSYPLDGGPILTYLVLTLPTGATVKAQVTSEDAEKLIVASTNQPASTPAEPEYETTFSLIEHAEEGQVEWETLSDSAVAPVYKQILRDMGVAAVLPSKEFEALLDEISTHLRDQALVQAAQQPKPAGPHVIPRQRKVAADDMGYPIVPGMRTAPGGESGHDSDEDGVAQL